MVGGGVVKHFSSVVGAGNRQKRHPSYHGRSARLPRAGRSDMTEPTRLGVFLRKSGAFLAVGGVAFVVDAVTFNLLVFGFGGDGPMYDDPLVAKIIAIVVATVVTY